MKLIFFIFLLLFSILFKLSYGFQEEYRFVEHLLKNAYKNEAIEYIEAYTDTANVSKIQLDSMNFQLGSIYLSIEKYDPAAKSFFKCSKENINLYEKARIYASLAYVLDHKDINALNIINDLESRDSDFLEFLSLYNNFICLKLKLQSDTNSCLFKTVQANEPGLIEMSEKITALANKFADHKSKSPLLAAMLSAIVPGLGKVYASHPNQGLASFFSTLIFAVQAYEGYYFKGMASPHLYVFATLGLIFYTGNIIGSFKSAQKHDENMKQLITYEIHNYLLIYTDIFFSKRN